MKILKIVSLVILILLIVMGISSYLYLKKGGHIPRHDYETQAPAIPAFNRPAVLVLNKTNGFIHKDAIPAADAMLKRIADKQGWDLFISNNGATHNSDVINQFDLIVWNNVSGDVLTEDQRNSLKQWLNDGGGWIGIHAAGGDPHYDWDWYVETLIGTQFVGHTMDPQFQDADILVADTSLPMTSHLPTPWRIAQEEWYAFDNNPRDKGYEIILTIDEDSYITKGKNWRGGVDNMEGEHPMAWRHIIGEGRVFYSAIGHQAATYELPDYEKLITEAMNWAIIKNP